jgi:hypothetical protein
VAARASGSALAENRGEALPLQIIEEHSAPQFPSEPTYFSQPHGAHHLDELGVPGADQVHNSLSSIFQWYLIQTDWTFDPVATVFAHSAFESGQDGQVNPHTIDTADHYLGHVLGHGDAA